MLPKAPAVSTRPSESLLCVDMTSGVIIAAYAIPGFLFAILLIVLFAGGSFFDWFPLRGLVSDNWAELSWPERIVDYFWHLTLPLTAMVLSAFATTTLLTKNSFLDEIKKYNAAVKKDVKFDPNIKDGRGTVGLAINKSNWANTIEEPPFEAYQVGCGLSFTFGGVRIDPDSGQVIDSDMNPIPGLYAAGELVGGIFYFNYPGGSGLMSGTVFGRIAGTGASAAMRNA